MNFGTSLLKHRKQKGITQDELAEFMQVSRQTISKWENGEALPEFSKVIKLADYFEISIDELCDRTITNYSKPPSMKREFDNKIPKKSSKLGMTIVLFFTLFFLGGFCGYLASNAVSSVNATTIPDKINVSGISFTLNKHTLSCTFVPSIYSEQLEYKIVKTKIESHEDKSVKTQEYDVIFENGIGFATINGIDSLTSYKLTLKISNEHEHKSIVLVNNLTADPRQNLVFYE